MEVANSNSKSRQGNLILNSVAKIPSIPQSNVKNAQQKVETPLTVVSSPPASPSSFVTAHSGPTSPSLEAEQVSALTSNIGFRTKKDVTSTKAQNQGLVLFGEPLFPVHERSKLLATSVALSELPDRLCHLQERISRCEIRNRSLKLRARLLHSQYAKVQAFKDSLKREQHTQGQQQAQVGAEDDEYTTELETSQIVSVSQLDIPSSRSSSDGDTSLDPIVLNIMNTQGPDQRATKADMWSRKVKSLRPSRVDSVQHS